MTAVARTLVDLARVVPAQQLTKALGEAERRRLLDVDAIEAARLRVRGRRGGGDAALRAALDEHRRHGVSFTRSELELRFLALLDAEELPRPLMNATLHGVEVDALWPGSRLVVELDGWAFHHTREAFQRDRAKANALELLGYAVLRYTHDDIARRGARVAGQVASSGVGARRVLFMRRGPR